jgi:very-short-patch-repair endonuclease
MVRQQQLAGIVAAPPKKKRVSRVSLIEDKLDFQLRAFKLTGYVREHRFALELPVDRDTGKPRQWRFDFAWVQAQVAVEVEGFNVQRLTSGRFVCIGAHTDPAGFLDDMDKYNMAAEHGWTVLRFGEKQIQSGAAAATIQRVLARKGAL